MLYIRHAPIIGYFSTCYDAFSRFEYIGYFVFSLSFFHARSAYINL